MTDNAEAIQLLDEWFAEPDEMEFWDEYEQSLVPFQIGVPEYHRPVVCPLTGKQ